MVSISDQHFNIHRTMLLTIGLWPYQHSRFVYLQGIVISGILASIIIYQLVIFLTTKCTIDLIIEGTTFILLFGVYITKYHAFWVNIQNLRYLLEQLEQICNELRDENEISIMEHYGVNAKHETIIIILLFACSMFFIIIQPIWQHIFTTSAFINIYRSHITIQEMIHSFKREMHVYLKLLHMITAICIGATVLTATGTMLLGYLKHICGMFRIASYRFEQAMEIDNSESIGVKNEITIYKGIIYAVDIHRKAMKCTVFLISNFEKSFLSLIIFTVTCLSCNLYRVFQIISFGGNTQQLVLHCWLICGLLTYLFLANHAAQEIMDHNDYIFFTVYNIRWYTAPLYIQRIILFLLQRGTKIFHIKLGGVFIGSLENFSVLLSASVSYFSVIYTTQSGR